MPKNVDGFCPFNKVKGQNPSTFFGIYDVCRWDNVWLQS